MSPNHAPVAVIRDAPKDNSVRMEILELGGKKPAAMEIASVGADSADSGG